MRSLVKFLVLSTCLVISSATSICQADRPPNVLLIVADDLGFSDLGCYGGEIDTPHLDALARDGIRFTRFYNTGRCCPSRGCLLTGQYPHKVGLGHMTKDLGRPGYRGGLKEGVPTMAQVLNSLGYQSYLSGKWHLGTADPTQHGFQEFYGTLVSAKTFWDPDHYLRLPADRTAIAYSGKTFYGTDAVTDHALEFLQLARQQPQRPWFLSLAYHAPHFPLQAPAEEVQKYADRYHVGWDEIRQRRLQRMIELGIVPAETQLTPRSPYWDYGEKSTGTNPEWSSLPEDRRDDLARRMAIYAAMIDRLDQNVGRLFDDLKSADEFENTLIVFLSDNGACAEWDPFGFDISSSPNNKLHRGSELEQMGGPGTFHSAGSGWANASNTPWRMYKHYNHEGGISSPCIIHLPKVVDQPGSIERTPCHLIDFMPTVIDLAHGPVADKPYPGQSLLPLLRGDPLNSRALFFEHEGNRAVQTVRWKLVALKDQAWELYDLQQDRSELNNLVEQKPNLVRRLERAWTEWAQQLDVIPFPKDYGVQYLKTK